MQINLSEAEKFLKAIHIDREIIFSTSFEKGEKQFNGNIFGTFKDKMQILIEDNKKKRAVYFCVNGCSSRKRTSDNVNRINAFFIDIDKKDFSTKEWPEIESRIKDRSYFDLEPSIIVESGGGYHIYWLSKDNNIKDFKLILKELATKLRGDLSAVDLSRLLRVPGFYHHKDKPKMVKMIHFNQNLKYTSKQILEGFNLVLYNPKWHSFLEKEKIQSALDLFKKAPIEEGEANQLGGRNKTIVLCLIAALTEELPKEQILKELNEYCSRSDYEISEALATYESLKRKNELKPFEPFKWPKNGKNKEAREAKAARFFTNHLADKLGSKYPVVNSERGLYLRNNRGSYDFCSDQQLQAEIHKYRVKELNEHKKASENKAVVEYIKQDAFKKSISECPIFNLDSDEPFDGSYNIIGNGWMYDIKERVKKVTPPEIFTVTTIESELDLSGKPPTFFLEKINEICSFKNEVVDLILKFYALCMVYNTSFDKFLLLIGEGANGKSVLLKILEAVIGRGGSSSVSISQMIPARTFPIAELHLKKVNFINEVDSGSKTSEGLFKALVSGDSIQVERKGAAPFTLYNTARMIIATNQPPVIKDNSDGFWRRLMPIKLTENFEQSGKADRNLSNISFWKEHKEMPLFIGLLIKKLHELYDDGKFIEPKEVKILNKSLMTASNPVMSFFEDKLEVLQMDLPENPENNLYIKSGVTQKDLFEAFKYYCEDSGIRHNCNTKTFSGRLIAVLDKQKVDYRVKNRIQEVGGKKLKRWLGFRILN